MKFRINFQCILLLALGMTLTLIITAAMFFIELSTNADCFKSVIPEITVMVTALFLILAGTGLYFTDRIIRPVEKLSETIGKKDAEYDEIEVEYKELSALMDTIKRQQKGIVDNADMRQQFTANVTHELKTPLTAITGYSELIENGMASGDDVKRFAGEIRRNSLRLLTLINDTIRLSELDMVGEEEEKEYFDLYEVADTCLNMLQITAEANMIELSLEGSHGTLYANKAMIEEVVYNLCDNAIRYNVKGGEVTVSVKDDFRKVIMSVKDTGIGIPKEHQSRIFERFYRVDKSRSKEKGGTGLGLAIVKHILARYGAEIYIASEVGKGTEIIVIFNKY
ncbi:MAG: ATP-binding protein [Bacillota bacterium]|nr:ATP-binding protein [Bacillota bacterium]